MKDMSSNHFRFKPPTVRYSILILTFCVTLLAGRASGQEVPSPTPCDKAPLAANKPNPSPIVPVPDVALDHWDKIKKYFIIISATKTANPAAELNFAKVNAAFLANILRNRGYTELDTLTAENANVDKVRSALQQTRGLPDNGLVLVYYTGHGVKDSESLYLQLYGENIGAGHGISVDELIRQIKKTAGYEGELAIILDSCFSGFGTLNTLTSGILEKTTILTSSSKLEESHVMEVDGSQTSAFTYFLTQTLTDDWERADADYDGILTHEELFSFLTQQLGCALFKRQINGPMTPTRFINSQESFIAYDQNKVWNNDSPLRKILRLSGLFQALENVHPPAIIVETASTDNSKPKISIPRPEPSEMAIGLAEQVKRSESRGPASNPNSTLTPDQVKEKVSLALKSVVNGQFDNARNILLSFDAALYLKRQEDMLLVYKALGITERYAGHYQQSLSWYQKGLKLKKDDPNLLKELAYTYVLINKLKQADGAYKKAVEAKAKALGSDHPEVADILDEYSIIKKQLNKKEDSLKLEKRAEDIRTKVAKSPQ